MCEIVNRSGIVEWRTSQLSDPRRQEVVVHDRASPIRTSVLLTAQGWRDHGGADALRDGQARPLAVSSTAGCRPIHRLHGLASQSTPLRFTTVIVEPTSWSIQRMAAVELGARAARAARDGKRSRRLNVDVDSRPIAVHGDELKAESNIFYRSRIYHPLVTSVSESGDTREAHRRVGKVGTAEDMLDVCLHVVERVEATL